MLPVRHSSESDWRPWLGTLGLGGGNTIPPPASQNFTSDIAAELTATTQRSRLNPAMAGPRSKNINSVERQYPCACYLLSVHLNGVVSTPKWCCQYT